MILLLDLSLSLHACTSHRCRDHCQTPLSTHPLLSVIMTAATTGCTGHVGSTLRAMMGGANMQERLHCTFQINLSTRTIALCAGLTCIYNNHLPAHDNLNHMSRRC